MGGDRYPSIRDVSLFFLDTVVLGHLTDGRFRVLQSAVRQGRVELCTSASALDELVLTSENDTLKRLATYALGLCGRKIKKRWNDLVRQEIEAYFRSATPPDILCDSGQQERYRVILQRLSAGAMSNSSKGAGLLREHKAGKRSSFKRQRELYQRHSGFSKEAVGEWSFEEFWERWLKNPEVEQSVRKLLLGNAGGGGDHRASTLISARGDLPHFDAALKVVAALNYSEGKGRKPKDGNDRSDCRLMICAATLSGFVSDEAGLEDIFQWTYPGKRFLSLQELVTEVEATSFADGRR